MKKVNYIVDYGDRFETYSSIKDMSYSLEGGYEYLLKLLRKREVGDIVKYKGVTIKVNTGSYKARGRALNEMFNFNKL